MLDRGVWPQRSCPAGSVGSARSFIARCTSRGAHLDLVFTGPLQLGRTQAALARATGSIAQLLRWLDGCRRSRNTGHNDPNAGVSAPAHMRKW